MGQLRCVACAQSTVDNDNSNAPAADVLAPIAPREAIDEWTQLIRQTGTLLRNSAPDAAWLVDLKAAAVRLRALAGRDLDAALYLLLQAAATNVERYSAHHSMLCAVICEVCARSFAWPDDEVDSVVHAALTMNLSMSLLQDALAQQVGPLSDPQREQVGAHAERSAELLTAAGVDAPLWIEVVRLHHARLPAADPSAAQRLAQLLQRIDVYTAKLSLRTSRSAVSPAIAARDACTDATGKPDAVGSTILRLLGLYPPGCFVQMASGDIGVVVRRGAKAHTPVAAALRRLDGGLYMPPSRRDTSSAQHAIQHGVTSSDVNVHVDHARTLGCA